VKTSHDGRRAGRGFTLLEVLIALVVLGFGMLALARTIGHSSQEEMEAYQRTQAMTVASELVDRIRNNPKHAALYVGDYIPAGPTEDCTVLDPSDVVGRDQCEFRNRLRGADILDAAKEIGAPIAARACVVTAAPNIYVIAVAWQGLLATAPADSPCGAGAFDNEDNRRVYSTVIQVATLGA
jgi:type IV pilus assembly protein PilV